MQESDMRTPAKAVLTALCVAVLIWPLLHWGKAARLHQAVDVETFSDRPIFNLGKPSDVWW